MTDGVIPSTFDEWWARVSNGPQVFQLSFKDAFEAGAAAERERCAKVAESFRLKEPPVVPAAVACDLAYQHVASAIRALPPEQDNISKGRNK